MFFKPQSGAGVSILDDTSPSATLPRCRIRLQNKMSGLMHQEHCFLYREGLYFINEQC